MLLFYHINFYWRLILNIGIKVDWHGILQPILVEFCLRVRNIWKFKLETGHYNRCKMKTYIFFFHFFQVNSYDNNSNYWKLQKRLPGSYEDIWEYPIITHLFSRQLITGRSNWRLYCKVVCSIHYNPMWHYHWKWWLTGLGPACMIVKSGNTVNIWGFIPQ